MRIGSVTAIGLAGLCGFVVGRRVSERRRMPYLGVWQKKLAEKRGAADAALLAGRVQDRFDDLYAGRLHLPQRALRIHLERNILPGLALYQALRDEGDDQPVVLAEVEALFEAVYGQLGRPMPLLGRLPDPFAGLRTISRWVIRWGFPPQGWDMEWVEDSEHCLAYDVRRCFYLDVLTQYGSPELTAHFCNMDDVAFAELPPSIAWERTKTLGRGDDVCNFRWRRVGAGPS